MDILLLGYIGRKGLENINADVRWTSACHRLDGGNTIT